MSNSIADLIKANIPANTVIPKPDAKADFVVKGWGKRRGEDALIYSIPNHKNVKKHSEKGVNVSEWNKAYRQLLSNGEFDKDWFTKNLQGCAEEGDCNFTSIGGIFKLLGFADYERGIYTLSNKR